MGNRLLWPDYGGSRQQKVGRARKCRRKFFGYDPSPAELAEKTIYYAEAKTAYFNALRAELPELMKIATGKEARPPEVDTFAAAFAVAGEDQEITADKRDAGLAKAVLRQSGN